MRVLLVGNGGRESAIARKLGQEAQLCAYMAHQNPTITECVTQSGGEMAFGSADDGDAIAAFAHRAKVDLAVVSSDNPLEAGVVDALHAARIPTVGPTRAGAEIEWNKVFARELLNAVLPEYAPRYWIINDEHDLERVFRLLEHERLSVVVKPAGLTGGKGVKVMGAHLKDLPAARGYAQECLARTGVGSGAVVIEERLEGVEFTVQGVTDGRSILRVPATFDYPFRYDGDTGPGTGGMGSFSDRHPGLPFLSPEIYDRCIYVMERVLSALAEQERHFNGVLNGGFFLTPRGLKVMEFNARFGDPECINIMAVLDSSLLSLFSEVVQGRLAANKVSLGDRASVTKYLVSPEYGVREGKPHEFSLDVEAIESRGVQVLFSSATYGREKNKFVTVGNSRSVALAATAPTPPEASELIEYCLEQHFKGPLERRKDVGSARSLQGIAGEFRQGADGCVSSSLVTALENTRSSVG